MPSLPRIFKFGILAIVALLCLSAFLKSETDYLQQKKRLLIVAEKPLASGNRVILLSKTHPHVNYTSRKNIVEKSNAKGEPIARLIVYSEDIMAREEVWWTETCRPWIGCKESRLNHEETGELHRLYSDLLEMAKLGRRWN